MAAPGGDPEPAPTIERDARATADVTDTYVSEAMAAAVGSELGRRTSYPITDSDIRRWAVAVYYPESPPRLFWDADYAATTPHGGIVAPEEFNPFTWMTPPVSGAPRRRGEGPAFEAALGVEPPPTRFMLNGGQSVEYGVRMRPGDVITARTTLAAYRERAGRLGLMLFTITAEQWTNQADDVVRRSESTLIRY